MYWLNAEAVVQRCSVEKMFLEISQKSLENTCARVSFSVKLQASGLKFLRTSFLQNTSGGCFCKRFINFIDEAPPTEKKTKRQFRLGKITNWLN